MTRLIFHSADFDGHASGAIARFVFENILVEEFTMHGYNYGNPFPHEKFQPGDNLIFMDVVYQPYAEIKEWKDRYGYNIKIIDHHKSFIDMDVKDYIDEAVLDSSKSGCELTWEHFFPENKMPKFISLLGRYDVWDKSDDRRWNNEILPFQMGFNLFDTNPADDKAFHKTWLPLFEMSRKDVAEWVDEVVYKGKLLKKYQDNMHKKTASWASEELKFMGRKAIVINSPERTSHLFNSIWDEKRYDLMLVYSRSKFGITASMYTTRDDVNVSEIAKQLGGGGHPQAAGFGASDVKVDNGEIEFML
jgi:oligoribonuclease NrnB/cAMP/cGMP phosphodiesterase (DHH superfamily)